MILTMTAHVQEEDNMIWYITLM